MLQNASFWVIRLILWIFLLAIAGNAIYFATQGQGISFSDIAKVVSMCIVIFFYEVAVS